MKASGQNAFLLPILMLLLASSCMATEGVLSPDVLNAHASLYADQLITVEGYAVIGFEQRFLFTSKSDAISADSHGHCLTLVNAGRLLKNPEKYNNRNVRLRGRFIADLAEKHIIVMGACSSLAIDLDNEFEPELIR